MSKNVMAPSHLVKLLGAAGLEIKNDDLTASDYFQEAVKAKQKSVLHSMLAGMYYTKAREIEGHGFITTEAARLGISKRSIYNDIDVYELFKRAPKATVQALSQLDFVKLLPLKRLDDSELADFTSGKEVRGITIEEAIDLPSRELERRLNEAVASNNELEQQLNKERAAREKAEEQIKLYKKKQNSIEGFIYPESVERVRIEGSVLATQAIQCLDDMEQFMTELTLATDLSSKPQKQESEFSAGAATLYLNLKSVHSKASYLLNWFAETIGEDYMPTDPEDTPLLSKEEAMKVHNMREVMLIEHDMEKQARESVRKSKRRQSKKAK